MECVIYMSNRLDGDVIINKKLDDESSSPSVLSVRDDEDTSVIMENNDVVIVGSSNSDFISVGKESKFYMRNMNIRFTDSLYAERTDITLLDRIKYLFTGDMSILVNKVNRSRSDD